MPQSKPGIATTILAPDLSGEGFIEITPNKTLLVQKLTGEDPVKPELIENLETVEEVFNHFNPGCSVELIKEDGSVVQEHYTFGSIGDFDVSRLIAKSTHLQQLNMRNEAYSKIRKQLATNKSLKTIVSDRETKNALIHSLKTLIHELEK